MTTCDLGFSDGFAVCGPHTQEQLHLNRRAQFSGHCIWPVGSRLSGLRRGQVCHLAALFVINKSPHIQGSTLVSVNREQRSPLTLEDHLLKHIVDYDRGGSYDIRCITESTRLMASISRTAANAKVGHLSRIANCTVKRYICEVLVRNGSRKDQLGNIITTDLWEDSVKVFRAWTFNRLWTISIRLSPRSCMRCPRGKM